jgi:hypothetical protein
MGEPEKQLTVRIPDGLYMKIRFLAADKDMSVNDTITLYLQEATAGARISPPTELLSPPSLPQRVN